MLSTGTETAGRHELHRASRAIRVAYAAAVWRVRTSQLVPWAQVNLDFSSEADMVDTMRLGIALQPIATALFANSPFRDGKPTGYLSWRSHVWTDTDPDR